MFVRFSLRRRHANISRFRWSDAKRSRRVRSAHDAPRIHQHLSRYSRFIIVAIHKRLRDTKTRPIFRDRASILARVKGQSGNMRGVIPTCVIGFSSRDTTAPPHTRSYKSDVFARGEISHGRSEYITRINAFPLRLSIVEEFASRCASFYIVLQRTYFEEINY